MIDKTHKDWPAGPSLIGWRALGALLTIMEILEQAMFGYIGDAKKLRKCAACLATLTKEYCEQSWYNLNLQIRAFVLSCPKRRAFVRGVIGEAAIKRWEIRFANSFGASADKPAYTEARPRTAPKSYKWKPYALPKIDNIFKGVDFSFPDFPGFPELPTLPELSRPRRGFQPAVFYPRELRPNYQHIPKTPHPKIVELGRKSEALRAAYYKKAGRAPPARSGRRDTAPDAQTKPP